MSSQVALSLSPALDLGAHLSEPAVSPTPTVNSKEDLAYFWWEAGRLGHLTHAPRVPCKGLWWGPRDLDI